MPHVQCRGHAADSHPYGCCVAVCAMGLVDLYNRAAAVGGPVAEQGGAPKTGGAYTMPREPQPQRYGVTIATRV